MKTLYKSIKKKIDAVDFNALFQGFYQMPFALYNDTQVFLEDRVVAKTNQFYGNTSIKFEGNNLAIWYIKDSDQDDLDILTSKIIHEMFHAYQMERNDPRFPNEIYGVRYPYDAHNLSIKQKEHALIVSLLETFTEEKFNTLCTLKHYRQTTYTEAYDYESAIETIEGLAVYVELKALSLLNKHTYESVLERHKAVLLDITKLVPIRQVNYTSGALLLLLADKNAIAYKHTVGEETTQISSLICNQEPIIDISIPQPDDAVKHIVNAYEETVKVNIETKLKVYDTHITGVFEIVGLDPMNTMYMEGTLYCKHILAYKDGDDVHYIKKASVSRVNEQMQLLDIFY